MSLSKIYKESRHFHPEEILPRTEIKEAAWPDVVQPKTAFLETPSGKSFSGQGFRPESMISPTPKPLPALSATPPLGVGSSPGDTGGAEETPAEEAAPGLDPLVVEQMVNEAFGRGIEEGLRRAETDFGSAAAALLELCRQLDRIRENLLKNSAGEMQNLILAIAEKIIRTSVLEQDATLLATVEEAIRSAVKSDEFYIYVNPADFTTVQEKTADLVSGLSGLNNLVLRMDPSIERGGCKVESDNCTVDATIASQFEIIRDQVRNRLSNP